MSADSALVSVAVVVVFVVFSLVLAYANYASGGPTAAANENRKKS
jgi:hypothetical protein